MKVTPVIKPARKERLMSLSLKFNVLFVVLKNILLLHSNEIPVKVRAFQQGLAQAL